MKWVLIGVSVLGGVVALVALIGWLLPKEHAARRGATLAAPPDVIWKAVTDVDAYPSWRRDVKTVHRLPDRAGRPAWVEEGGDGRLTFVVDEWDPPRRLVTRIADPSLPFGGSWTYEMVPSGAGTALTITENGEIYNPIFRFMARFILGYERTLDTFLSALKAKVGG